MTEVLKFPKGLIHGLLKGILERPKQTAQAQIRLLLKKQSDQGLPCLQYGICEFQPGKRHFIHGHKENSV